MVKIHLNYLAQIRIHQLHHEIAVIENDCCQQTFIHKSHVHVQ